MKKPLPLIIFVLLVAGSCSKNSQDNPAGSISGKFTMKSLSAELKSAPKLKSTNTVTFNLDTVKSSQSYYFILGNAGQEDIKNITLTSDNPSFTISPSTINVLPGTANDTGSTMIQILALQVVHGNRLNGVGYTSLLKMGTNTANLTITGQTSDGTNTVAVNLNVSFSVFAKVMDVTLSQGGSEFDLSKPDGHEIGFPGISSVPEFNYYSTVDPVYLKNTGNTLIDVTMIDNTNSTILQSSTINLSDSLALNLPAVSSTTTQDVLLKLNAEGTVCDQTKIPLGTDGEGYIELNGLYYIPPVTPVDSTQ